MACGCGGRVAVGATSPRRTSARAPSKAPTLEYVVTDDEGVEHPFLVAYEAATFAKKRGLGRPKPRKL